jgi:hypothetical protein
MVDTGVMLIRARVDVAGIAVVVALLVAASACTADSPFSTGDGQGQPGPAGGARDGAGEEAGKASVKTTEESAEEPRPFAPAPNASLLTRPLAVAQRLSKVTAALEESIEEWTKGGPPEKPAPKVLALQALYQQRIYRRLAQDGRLPRRVVARLDGRLARDARRLAEAGARLRSLVTAIESPVTLKLQEPESPADLLAYYKAAERRFGVDRYVLASINYVESKFGRVRSSSPAGAQGPMQFLPSTWEAYGLGGDIDDPRDAILGAANYLTASGAPENYRDALFAYNHADAYVDAVLIYARAMQRDPQMFYALYNWQVFAITQRGDVRVTGPGHRYDKKAVVLP